MHSQKVQLSPFIHTGNTSDTIYTVKNIVLVILVLFGCYQFGSAALLTTVVVVSVVFCTDSILHYMTKRRLFWEQSIQYALLIAACIPPASPLVLIVPVTLGVYLLVQWTAIHDHRPICNPALAVLAVLYAFFPTAIQSGYIEPTFWIVDAHSSATPLSGISTQLLSNLPVWISNAIGGIQDVFIQVFSGAYFQESAIHFFGLNAGSIAEQFSLFILLGSVFFFAYSCIKIIPIVFAATSFVLCVYVFAGLTLENELFQGNVLFHLFNGGFLFALFFFVGDPAVSSESNWGNCLFGLCFGIFAALFRIFATITDGTVFALVLTSMLVPLWDRFELTLRRWRYRYLETKEGQFYG